MIAAGATALGILGAGIFRASNLRGDSNTKWSTRILLAASALDEKIVTELQALRGDIETALPGSEVPFDPANAIADPQPLSARVEKVAKFYRARVRMDKDLRRVLRLGRVFVVALILLALASGLLTCHYGELVDWSWLRVSGLIAGGLGAAVAIGSMGVYIVCVDRLASAEILAGTAAQANMGDAE